MKALEEKGLGLLLPFCIMKYRHEVAKAKTGGERREFAALMEGLLEELVGAVERSAGRGEMGASDVGK